MRKRKKNNKVKKGKESRLVLFRELKTTMKARQNQMRCTTIQRKKLKFQEFCKVNTKCLRSLSW